jgi:hypothetical protein
VAPIEMLVLALICLVFGAICFLISILLELRRIRKLLEAQEKQRAVEGKAQTASVPDRPAS